MNNLEVLEMAVESSNDKYLKGLRLNNVNFEKAINYSAQTLFNVVNGNYDAFDAYSDEYGIRDEMENMSTTDIKIELLKNIVNYAEYCMSKNIKLSKYQRISANNLMSDFEIALVLKNNLYSNTKDVEKSIHNLLNMIDGNSDILLSICRTFVKVKSTPLKNRIDNASYFNKRAIFFNNELDSYHDSYLHSKYTKNKLLN